MTTLSIVMDTGKSVMFYCEIYCEIYFYCERDNDVVCYINDINKDWTHEKFYSIHFGRIECCQVAVCEEDLQKQCKPLPRNMLSTW